MVLNDARNAVYEAKKKLYKHTGNLFVKEYWLKSGDACIIATEKGHRFAIFYRAFYLTKEMLALLPEHLKMRECELILLDQFEHYVYELDIYQFLFIYPHRAIFIITAGEIKTKGYQWTNHKDQELYYIFPRTAMKRLM